MNVRFIRWMLLGILVAVIVQVIIGYYDMISKDQCVSVNPNEIVNEMFKMECDE